MALVSTLLLIHKVVPIYGTMFALVIAMVIAGLPLTVQVIKAYLMQLAVELEEASQVAGANLFTTFRRILFPLVLPCLIVVGLLEFITSARNISTVVLLATGQTRTLALLMLDFTAGRTGKGDRGRCHDCFDGRGRSDRRSYSRWKVRNKIIFRAISVRVFIEAGF